MATHVVIAALSGLILLAVFILTVGDPTRALSVWLIGAATGGVASFLVASSTTLRRLAQNLIRT